MYKRFVLCLFFVWCAACGGESPEPEDSPSLPGSASSASQHPEASAEQSEENSQISEADSRQSAAHADHSEESAGQSQASSLQSAAHAEHSEESAPQSQASAEQSASSAGQSQASSLQSQTSSRHSESGTVSSQDAYDFDAHVRALGKINMPPSHSEPVQTGTAQTNWYGNDYTVTAWYRAAPEFSEVLALDPGSETIWPGAVLQGQSVLQGDYVPLTGKRAPLSVSISPANTQIKRFVSIENPRLADMRQAIGEILSQNLIGSVQAKISFSIEEVHNARQLALAVGAGFENAISAIETQFNFSNADIRSRILVKCMQVYYTADISLPERPGDLFAYDANLNAVRDELGQVSPLYISSVRYGNIVFLSFESAADIETLKTAAGVSCQALLDGIEGEISPVNKTVVSNAVISATVINSNGTATTSAIHGLDGLKPILLAGKNYDKNSLAPAISYTMRSLSDNTAVCFVLTGEYEARHTYRAYDWYAVRDLRIACGAEDGTGKSAKFYGDCAVSMTTNGIKVQGYENGSSANTFVWAVTPALSSNWNLNPGQWKGFGCERLFRVRRLDLDKAILRVSGNICKYGLILDTELGGRERSIALNAIPEGMIWLPTFSDGDIKARIGFTITRLYP